MALYSMIQFGAVILTYFQGSVLGNCTYFQRGMTVTTQPQSLACVCTDCAIQRKRKRENLKGLRLCHSLVLSFELLFCSPFLFACRAIPLPGSVHRVSFDNLHGCDSCAASTECEATQRKSALCEQCVEFTRAYGARNDVPDRSAGNADENTVRGRRCCSRVLLLLTCLFFASHFFLSLPLSCQLCIFPFPTSPVMSKWPILRMGPHRTTRPHCITSATLPSERERERERKHRAEREREGKEAVMDF